MSEKLKKITKEVQEKARPKIDCKAELIDPIDFSFKDLMSLEGTQKYITIFFEKL